MPEAQGPTEAVAEAGGVVCSERAGVDRQMKSILLVVLAVCLKALRLVGFGLFVWVFFLGVCFGFHSPFCFFFYF